MPLRAGFAETDITPPLGAEKIGWLKRIVADRVLDPLFARVAVIESGDAPIAFVQLDTLVVRHAQTARIRQEVQQRFRFPGERIMVAATHNHCGPAVETVGEVPRDDAYVETMIARIVSAFGEALGNLQPAEVGCNSVFEWGVSHNRRIVTRDGVTKSEWSFKHPDALYLEGPIDPEVAVLAARGTDGGLLGVLVNFACHPCHHGGEPVFTAGFPGALAAEMKSRGCPVTLFLNGASGNTGAADPRTGEGGLGMEQMGRALADDVEAALEGMAYHQDLRLGCAAATLQLPFRALTDDQISGTARGAQRFVDPAIYERLMPALVEMIRERKTQPAEVQALSLGDCSFVAIPAEFFVQLGLQIKERAYPRRALVVSCANGWVGYVPHREAFDRGGYETTFAGHSKLAPAAGDLLVQAALQVIADSAA